MSSIFSCKDCRKSFVEKSKLLRHQEICNISNEKKEIDNLEIKCIYCNKIFLKKSKLTKHLNSIRGDCFKLRNGQISIIEKQINNYKTINNITNNNITNNIQQNIQNNIQNIQQQNIIQLQPVIKEKVILAKHGEETISHITKEVMLKILDIESFPEMCTELMRLLYFNKEVPENRNWTIVYPKNQNAGVEFNHTTQKFEIKKTYNIIDDKFSNMVTLLFDLVQEISRDDIENNNLSKRQKINVNKYCMHYGQLEISKTSELVYDSIHSLAYNSRIEQMKEWGESGHKGNHLSLKF
jgi:Zinc finger, C2H2 type